VKAEIRYTSGATPNIGVVLTDIGVTFPDGYEPAAWRKYEFVARRYPAEIYVGGFGKGGSPISASDLRYSPRPWQPEFPGTSYLDARMYPSAIIETVDYPNPGIAPVVTLEDFASTVLEDVGSPREASPYRRYRLTDSDPIEDPDGAFYDLGSALGVTFRVDVPRRDTERRYHDVGTLYTDTYEVLLLAGDTEYGDSSGVVLVARNPEGGFLDDEKLAPLFWFGYTAYGTLAEYDENGYVRNGWRAGFLAGE
jgi:hypothetical protein